MPLNLNSDKLVVVIKQDQQPYIMTGYTTTTLVGSGATIATALGGGIWNVYSPVVDTSVFATKVNLNSHTSDSTIHFKQSGITISESQVTNLVHDLNDRSLTGHTHSQYGLNSVLTGHTSDSTIHFKQSGITISESQVTNLVSDLAGKVNTNIFTGHTSDSTIHFKQSGITISESQVTNLVHDLNDRSLTGHTHTGVYAPVVHIHAISDVTNLQSTLNSKSNTGHTHSQYAFTFQGIGGTNVTTSGTSISISSAVPTGTTVAWIDILSKPTWLTGTTLNQFETSHAHAQYGLNSTLTGHTSDSTIHFKQSGITISESQVTNLVHDLADRSLTGHTHAQYLTGQTASTWSSITSKPQWLSGATLGEFETGHTHSQYISGAPYTFTGSGATTVDETLHDIIIYTPVHVHDAWSEITSKPSWLSGTTLQAFQTGHTHSQYGLNSTLTGHTSDLSIHYEQSGITISESQVTNLVSDLAGKSGTGHTHSYTGTSITDKPDLSVYALNSTLTGHTSDSTIHFKQSGITINENQVTNLVTDLAGKSSTGHTHSYTGTSITDKPDLSVYALNSTLTGHTSDSTIHFKQSGITITENQVTGLVGKYVPYTTIDSAKDYTGFVDGSHINVSYNYTDKTMTLTGDLTYLWRGVENELTSPWTSTGHTGTVGHWYLSTVDGTTFKWSQSPWVFADLQVAHVYYRATEAATFGLRETHELMDWHSHEEFHNQLGTYLNSGGQATAGSYTVNSATDSGVSPSFDAANIEDEDLESVIGAWNKLSGYTLMYITGNTFSVYTLDAVRPFLAAGANQYMYVNNTLTGTMTAGQSARWYNVYQILIPVTSDVSSQKYRMVFLQPQATFTSLAAAQAEDTRGLKFGTLTESSSEYIIYSRISYSTNNTYNNYGRCVIPTNGITYVVGNKMSLVTVAGVSATNHANLSNLNWTDSGHLGGASTLAGFDVSNVAIEVPNATFSLSGHTHAQYATVVNLTGHTSDSTIHFKQSGITISESQVTNLVSDLANRSLTGHTHSQYQPTGTTLLLDQSTPQHVVDYPQFDGIDFTLFTGTTTTGIGRLQWGADGKTLEFGLSTDVNLQIGQETVVYVTNKTGSDLYNGNIVYCNGSQGQRPTIALADCRFNYQQPLAMLTENIGDNNSGWVTLFGLVHDIDTQAWSAGTTVYLSTGGTMSSTMPTAPKARRRMGVIMHQATNPTNGTMLFNATPARKLNDLSDVLTPATISGQIPVWDNNNLYFDFTANINNYSQTGHTHPQYLTGQTASTWSSITGKPQWLSGTTLGEFETGHTHSQYISGAPYTFTGSGATTVDETLHDIIIYSPVHVHDAWSEITSKPAWLSGTTLSAFEAQHAHASLYAPVVHSHARYANLSGATFSGVVDAGVGLKISGTTITASPTELNYVDGVTSAIQTQLGLKQTVALAITGITSMGNTSWVHGTPVAANKVQIKGLAAAGTGLSIVSSATQLTVSGATTDLFSTVTDGYLLARNGTAVTGVTQTKFATAANITTYTGTTAPATYARLNPVISGISTTYTLKAADNGKIYECNGTFTVTLPNSMPTGMQVTIVNIGTGTITLAASTTLYAEGTKLVTRYTAASAYHQGSNVWIAFGRLTT